MQGQQRGAGPDGATATCSRPHHGGDDSPLTSLLCPWKRSSKDATSKKHQKATTKKVTQWQLLHLFHRLAIFAAALAYIGRSVQGAAGSIYVLHSTPLPRADLGVYASPLIPLWAGAATIRTSPLVTLALHNTTAPIASTLYLESASTVSTTGCSGVAHFNAAMYSNVFLRSLAAALLAQTAYNLTFLAPLELIAPVVDCGFDGLVQGTQSLVRTHYLVRHKNVTDDVSLLTFSMSMQDYEIPKQNQKGPAGVATLELLQDMGSSGPVDHYYIVAQSYPYAALKFQVYTMLGLTADHEWRLLSIPSIPMLETPKEIVTASRRGMYINVETEQSNYRNANAVPDSTPSLVLSQWRWQGGTVLRDSWGWVHCVHVLFALDALVSMAVLFLVVYRNLLLGKIWVGDAFVSVANTLLYRSAIILLAWVVNDGWTIMEFCYANANRMVGDPFFYSEPAMVRADLLTLFLGLSSIVGYVLRERIDPALVVFLFEMGFRFRNDIGFRFPQTRATVTQYALADVALGTLPMSALVAQTTPLRLGTVHPLASKHVGFIFLSLLPTYSMLGFVIAYALARKLYRYWYPEKLHIVRTTDTASDRADGELQALKRNLTLFELATGAALQRRVGVVSDYENCLYIKGLKYASADGIYCSGYVIANGKFLLATTDLVAIFFMKLLRVRFKNIYGYEVDGSTVQQTARLLYPQTIAWHDLLRLNISVLS